MPVDHEGPTPLLLGSGLRGAGVTGAPSYFLPGLNGGGGGWRGLLFGGLLLSSRVPRRSGCWSGLLGLPLFGTCSSVVVTGLAAGELLPVCQPEQDEPDAEPDEGDVQTMHETLPP